MRLYGEYGPLQADKAASVEEALTFLDELKGLHQTYWRSRGRPGAFAEPFFERFHKRLIETAYPSGQVDLIRVRAGKKLIGYLYNFLYRGKVLSYQSGFSYEDESKFKPGMVSHVLTITEYLASGLDKYDFLAGDSQLKSSLSTDRLEMYWITLQRGKVLFKLEDFARSLRRRVS